MYSKGVIFVWLNKLNELKKRSGKTTDEVSELSGVPKGTLNKIFAGQTKDPQLSTVKSIVHVLGCTLDDLYDDEENKNPAPSQELDLSNVERTLVLNYRAMLPKDQEHIFRLSDHLHRMADEYVLDAIDNQTRERIDLHTKTEDG
jgi:transcriptional regulator with XRE-family HTH domain